MSELLQNEVTTFKVESVFQLTNKNFYLLGLITSGTIKVGMNAHLENIGISKKIQIVALELTTSEAVGLSFDSSHLTEQEKEYLRTKIPFETKIIIE